MNHIKNFVSTFGTMATLMREPSAVYSTNPVASTQVETRTYLWDVDDSESDVVISRTVEYDAGGLVISTSHWELTNGPTVSNVTTSETDNSTVSMTGETTLTITGTNFGAEDADLRVLVYFRPKSAQAHRTSMGTKEGWLTFTATISSVNVGDTEITASINVSELRTKGKWADRGDVMVKVANVKRKLISDGFTSLSTVG